MEIHQIQNALRRRYAEVAGRPVGQFKYPVGRVSAERLGYPAKLAARVPADVVDRFGGEQHELSGRAKDIGSAAVFMALLNVVIVWGLIVLSPSTAIVF